MEYQINFLTDIVLNTEADIYPQSAETPSFERRQ